MEWATLFAIAKFPETSIGARRGSEVGNQECLVATSDQWQRVYAFKWEVQGRDNALDEPNMGLELGVIKRYPDEHGNPPPRTFESDDDALQLSDAVLESIRLRPGTSEAGRPRPAGSYLNSVWKTPDLVRRIPVLCALLLAAMVGLQAHAVAGGVAVSVPDAGAYCIGLHELRLPAGAKVRLSATYAGLRDRDLGAARWDKVLESLRDRAQTAQSRPMSRSGHAAEIYRAGGLDPETMFSDSRLVGFDIDDEIAVIAEHPDSSAAFTIEAHRVLDGRHFFFEGEGSRANRYPAVRDGVLDDVSRYRPHAPGGTPPTDAFCTANGHFRLRDNEDVAGDAQLVVTFSNMPGVTFSLNIYGLVQAAKELSFVERAARDLLELTGLGGRVKRLHSGKRRYGGQSGDIVAIRMVSEESDASYDYKYFWHAAGRPMDAYAPEIEAELLAEGAHGLDQAALDALWTELMEGFTLRREMR